MDILNDINDIKLFFTNIIASCIKNIEIKNSENDYKKIDFILDYINLHYNEDLYLDYMAQLINTTPKYFSKYFKKSTKFNFTEYLNKVRLSHAKNLLVNKNLMIKDVVIQVGFKSNSTFSNAFSKFHGITPNEYRNKLLEDKNIF